MTAFEHISSIVKRSRDQSTELPSVRICLQMRAPYLSGVGREGA